MLLSKRHCKEYVCRITRIRQREKSFNEFNHLKRDKSDIAIIPDRSVNDRYHKGSLFTKSRLHRGMKIKLNKVYIRKHYGFIIIGFFRCLCIIKLIAMIKDMGKLIIRRTEGCNIQLHMICHIKFL